MSQTAVSLQASRAELDAQLPHVLNAPKTGSRVAMLCTRPARNERVFPDAIVLTRARGIDGDREMAQPWLRLDNGDPDPRIQVSIIPQRVLDLVWRDRENITHPGDNIVADIDVSLDNMPVGTILTIGTAALRVSDEWNDGCAKWNKRMGRAAYEWTTQPDHEPLRLRGIYCEIITDGVIKLGDTITVTRP